MARRPRHAVPSQFFHVINRAVRKEPLFQNPRDYRAFVNILHDGLERWPVRLLSYCILPNHWHLVVEPAGTRDLSKLMHWVTTTHAVRLHRRRRTSGQGPIYQGRFKAVPIHTGEAYDGPGTALVPPIRVEDFYMTSVSPAV